jgi:UDP-glucose 4-epimerase
MPIRNLVTGGAGFIGSHLVEHLVARGEHVTVWDDLSTGRVSNLSRVRDDITTIFSDINSDAALLDTVIQRVDVVYHLAAAVGVDLVVNRPIQSMRTNIALAELVIETCAKYRRPLFLASTSEVYGKSTRVPFQEDDDVCYGATTKHRWSYAMSKAIDEFYLLCYSDMFGLPGVAGRLFNTVGPRQVPFHGMVLPRFIHQALTGQPLTVYGDGNQRRCFTHVADIVPAIHRLVHCCEASGQIVNLGSAEEITILDLAHRVKDKTKSASPIVHVPYELAYRDGFEDLLRRVPDTSKAKRLVDFKVTRTMDDILCDAITHEKLVMSGA